MSEITAQQKDTRWYFITCSITKYKSVRPQPNDEEMVRKVAIKTKCGPGPYGMDAESWRKILASSQFGTSNMNLF